MNAAGGRVNPFYISLVVGLGSFSDGFALLLQSGALLSVVPYFHLNSLATGLLVSAPFIGSVFGALLFGRLADKFGRRSVILNVLLFFVVASILSAVSINVPMLLMSRFLVGVGIGGDVPSSGSLVAEISEPQRRGSLISIQTLLWAIGAFAATVVAIPFLRLGLVAWRPLFGLAAIPPLITLLLRRRISESSLWEGRRRSDSSVKVPRRIIAFIAVLCAGLFIWTFVLAIFASYLPSLLVRTYGFHAYMSLIVGGLQWIMYFAGCLITFKLIDRAGRRPLILTGSIVGLAAASSIYFLRAATPEYFTISIFFIWLAGGIAYTGISTYSFEISPTLLRGLLSGSVFASGRLGGYTGTQIFPMLLGLIGITSVFGLISLLLLTAAALVAPFNQRTERLTLDEIERALTGLPSH